MIRLQYFCWRWTDTVLGWIERVRVRAAARRAHIEPDLDEAAYDAAWAGTDETDEIWERAERPGKLICLIAVSAAAVWMVQGVIRG